MSVLEHILALGVLNCSRICLVYHMSEKPSRAGCPLTWSGCQFWAGILGLAFLRLDLTRLLLPSQLCTKQPRKQGLHENFNYSTDEIMAAKPQPSGWQILDRGQAVVAWDLSWEEGCSGVSAH